MIGTLRPLRDEQTRALDGLRASLMAGHRRPLVQAPCGFGKTVLGAHIVAGAMRKGKRVCFVVPALSLVDQTFDRFCENGIRPDQMGVIQGDHPHRRPNAPVQIATAQTLARRDRPEVDVVIVDEAHIRHRAVEAWMADCGYATKFGRTDESDDLGGMGSGPTGEGHQAAQKTALASIFIGLSATPWSRGLGLLFDDLVKVTSMADLITAGRLSPFRVFAPSHPDLSGVKTVAGDYHEGQLGDRMGDPVLVADVVETWLKRGEDRPTLCFAVNRAHAKKLHDQFESVGVRSAYIDANTPREERDDIGRQLARGDVQVVCNIGTLTTGVDWDVRCIILARPTKSESLYVQIVGRGLRTAEGKSECLILDHSDTVLRLGFPTEIDQPCLDDGRPKDPADAKKEEKERLPKDCPACAYLMPAGTTVCPACDHVMPGRPVIGTMAGELEELTAGGGRKRNPKGPPTRDVLFAMGKRSIMAQLHSMRDERGRKSGWVAHTYKAIFDVWPRGLDDAGWEEPSSALRSFVRSRDIAWAKSSKPQGGTHATI